MPRYRAYSHAAPTTGVAVPIAFVAATIKTALQIATPSTRQIQVSAWGATFDGSTAATAAIVELIQTDVAATVTAHVAAGVQPLDPNQTASLMTLGTSATGYNASAEGTTTASRSLDTAHIPPTGQYIYQWQDGKGPLVAVSKFLRVRVKTAAASTPNGIFWVEWDE